MDRTDRQWRFKEGDAVFAADDTKLGKVVAFFPDMTQPTHLVVEKGLLFPSDYFVPLDAVTNYDGERIYVGATRDEAVASGWDHQPAGPVPTEDAAMWSP